MHIIVAGGGVIGQRVAQALAGTGTGNGSAGKGSADKGNTVVVIEADAHRATELTGRGLRVVTGNACFPRRLEEAGALHADVLVACAGADEDNLIISVMARRHYGIPRIVAVIRDDANRWLFGPSWGVDAAISAASALVTLIDQATGALVQ